MFLALIGAGYWGRNLARNFHDLQALRVICDPSAELLETHRKTYPGITTTGDYATILADPAITAVAIAAPAALHFDLARRALEAGKDVYVEKPLCLQLNDAETLIALADKSKRILMVGHLLQYHPCVTTLRRMVEDGELGELLYLTSNRLNLGKFRTEENALWSFAPHDISVILSLTGTEPRRVSCTGHSHLTGHIHDTTLTVLDFGQTQAHIHVSWLHPFKEQKLTVVGTKAMAVFDDTKPWPEKLAVYRDYLDHSGDTPLPSPRKNKPEYPVIEEREPLHEECSHFLECCQSRATPRTDGHEGLRVLRILHSAQQSLEEGG